MLTTSPDIVDAGITPDSVVIRELPPNEYHKLEGVGLFDIFSLPNMEHAVPIIGQRASDGKIVMYWILFDAVHVEPLWIDPEFRKRPGIARRLWTAVQKAMVARGVPLAFACIADNDAAQNLPQALRLGFQKIPGSLYFIEVKPEPGSPEAEGWRPAGEQVKEILSGGGGGS